MEITRVETAKVRVRFAPSPTGPFHIGGARTALFNYLFARNAGGTFRLRIEDTDLERSKPEFEKEIIDALRWLGLDWDGDIIRQSNRLPVYARHVDQLLEKDLAYLSEGAVSFRIPKKKIVFDDLVHGKIQFDSASFDDFVIRKSNGFPTYNFACVVDDHEFGMTHLIRGDDHLSNTPKQILLYEAFGWEVPKLAHLPLVLGHGGEPLSKRTGEVNLKFYQEEGFSPDGILNYLSLLGWSSNTNQEFFKREELIKHFSLRNVNKTNAVFDLEKLKWLNGEHLRALSDGEFVRCGKTYLESKGMIPRHVPDERLAEILLLFKSRIRIWSDLPWQAEFFWKEEIDYDPKAFAEHFHGKETWERLRKLDGCLHGLSDFSDEKAIEQALRHLAEELGIPAKDLIHPTRVVLTGWSVSPGLISVMRIMGKEFVLKRFQRALQQFQKETAK